VTHSDCAAARDAYSRKRHGNVPIVTDGGNEQGGMFARRWPAALMRSWWAVHSQSARKLLAGLHWGMATARKPSRGPRIRVGATGSLKQILFGPAEVDDGSQNLIGAITTCMASRRAQNC